MDATLIVIDSDAELARARALVDRLMQSDDPADAARLAAQARLIAAFEEEKWPLRAPGAAEVVRYLLDQHGMTQADLVPFLGPASRVAEILRGQRHLSLAMVQRLRRRFGVPADLLLPPPRNRRAAGRGNGPRPEHGAAPRAAAQAYLRRNPCKGRRKIDGGRRSHMGRAMIDEIALHRDELAALCRRFHVRRLDLFGSAARGDFNPATSDVDFLVEFDRAAAQRPFDGYCGLKEALEELFGRSVDLVEAAAVRNP
ncbi:MAG: nucleotidyltransferase domain-containing protein [Stellaceae bacterium]